MLRTIYPTNSIYFVQNPDIYARTGTEALTLYMPAY